MDWETRASIFQQYVERESEIMMGKAREYASEEDTLSNFKLISHLLNKAVPLEESCPQCGHSVDFEISPFIVLVVYMMKHLLSILDWAGRGESLSDESLTSRILDLVVYAKLFDCLKRDLE